VIGVHVAFEGIVIPEANGKSPGATVARVSMYVVVVESITSFDQSVAGEIEAAVVAPTVEAG
jgi:hypothetical protein